MLYNILELKTNPFRHECSVLACRYWWDDKPCGRSGCDDNHAVLQAGRAGKVKINKNSEIERRVKIFRAFFQLARLLLFMGMMQRNRC